MIRLRSLLQILFFTITVFALSPPSSRTSPPSGALVVSAGTTIAGEYGTLAAAVAALPDDSSSQTVFLYPGTYTGQVIIERDGPVTLLGYSSDPGSYSANQVTITASIGASSTITDDESGTLRIHTNSVAIYNLNIVNGYGPGTQAIALSNYGNQVGVYGCQLIGYQDTLLTEEGVQVYLQSYIQGAVDFIFGQLSQAYFEGNTIAVSGSGCVTASGRSTDNSGIYLFSQNQIVLASDAASGTEFYFGRPWSNYSRVIFESTDVVAPLQPAMWSIWNTGDPRTNEVTYGDYDTYGTGVPADLERPSWATLLTAAEAATYNISTALGGDTSWIDTSYLIAG